MLRDMKHTSIDHVDERALSSSVVVDVAAGSALTARDTSQSVWGIGLRNQSAIRELVHSLVNGSAEGGAGVNQGIRLDGLDGSNVLENVEHGVVSVERESLEGTDVVLVLRLRSSETLDQAKNLTQGGILIDLCDPLVWDGFRSLSAVDFRCGQHRWQSEEEGGEGLHG